MGTESDYGSSNWGVNARQRLAESECAGLLWGRFGKQPSANEDTALFANSANGFGFVVSVRFECLVIDPIRGGNKAQQRWRKEVGEDQSRARHMQVRRYDYEC